MMSGHMWRATDVPVAKSSYLFLTFIVEELSLSYMPWQKKPLIAAQNTYGIAQEEVILVGLNTVFVYTKLGYNAGDSRLISCRAKEMAVHAVVKREEKSFRDRSRPLHVTAQDCAFWRRSVANMPIAAFGSYA